MGFCSSKGILLASILLFIVSGVSADDSMTIQLVGNFKGINCEPTDPKNNMTRVDTFNWRKLKFINEPGDPDTIFFKFTKDGTYLPKHWGWSGVWGTAKFDWDPPNIAKVLPDSGYYVFHFNHSTFIYSIDSPGGNIEGEVNSKPPSGVPAGTAITLYDSLYSVIGTYTNFTDSTFHFEHLPASTYHLTSSAPGYRDTTISPIELGADESKWLSILLINNTAVMIQAASCKRIDGDILVRWSTSCSLPAVGFHIFRGTAPLFQDMEKRNDTPIYSIVVYKFMDHCEDPYTDLYYYIVEATDDNPTRYGPLLVQGITPEIRSALGRNYPNPFNPATTIPYKVGPGGSNKPICMAFYDVAGRLVDSRDLGSKPVGDYTFRWNPTLSRKNDIPSGVYYCRLKIGKEIFNRKLILLR